MESNVNIDRYKSVLEQYNKAIADENAMQAQLAMIKKQAQEILQNYGCTKLSDISVLKDKLATIEAEIQQSEVEMIQYINAVNEKKAEKDRILLG